MYAWRGSLQAPCPSAGASVALEVALSSDRVDTSAMLCESRLPLVVRTSADVKILLANSRHVRKLPESGLKIAVAGLDASIAQKLNASIEAYVKACGCAAGGVFALVGLVVVVAGVALQISHRGPRWADLGVTGLGVLGALLLGGLGKLFGLMLARWRFESDCREVIRSIPQEQTIRSGDR